MASPSDLDFADIVSAFWTDGCCVLRSVVEDPTIGIVRNAVADMAGSDLADLGALAGDTAPSKFRAGVDQWRSDARFLSLATHGVLPTAAAAVLRSERLWLYEDSVLVKDAGSAVATRWHTDDGYFHVDGTQLATMWVPLDPAPLAAGALRFLPGSHADGHRYRPTLFVIDEAIPGTIGDQPPDLAIDDPSAIGYDLDVGDLTIHHARTLHAASGNSTTTHRRAWSIRYCGDDAVIRQKPGAPMKPGFEDIEPGTPIGIAAARLGLIEATLG